MDSLLRFLGSSLLSVLVSDTARLTGIDVCEGKKCRNNFRSNLIISLARVQDLINWP